MSEVGAGTSVGSTVGISSIGVGWAGLVLSSLEPPVLELGNKSLEEPVKNRESALTG